MTALTYDKAMAADAQAGHSACAHERREHGFFVVPGGAVEAAVANRIIEASARSGRA